MKNFCIMTFSVIILLLVFSACDANVTNVQQTSDITEQTTSETHKCNYDTPVFMWLEASDASAYIKAVFTCTADNSHTQEKVCEIKRNTYTDAEKGTTGLVESASVEYEGKTYISTRKKVTQRWTSKNLNSNNYENWLYTSFSHQSGSNNVLLEVRPLANDASYDEIVVKFTILVKYQKRLPSGGLTMNATSQSFSLGYNESRSVSAYQGGSVVSCTLSGISVTGSVSSWELVAEDWIYE